MADNEEQKQDPQGQSSETTDPSANQDGQSSKQVIQQAQDDLPEKFKGKSAAEIAKAHIELEKKLGEQSNEVNQSRQNLAQWEALGKVIQGNPALEQLIKEEIQKISDPDSKKETKQTTRDDTRIAVEKQVVKDFESELGIDKLDGDNKLNLQKKIGKELEEMLDPEGKLQASELIQKISLDKLPSLLRKAYKLATADDERERARIRGLVQARENRDAEFGTIPSFSSTSNGKVQLSPDELKVAKRFNMTPEEYVKNRDKQA